MIKFLGTSSPFIIGRTYVPRVPQLMVYQHDIIKSIELKFISNPDVSQLVGSSLRDFVTCIIVGPSHS